MSTSPPGLDLEAALRDLGSVLAAPVASGLGERVRARIEAEAPRPTARWAWPRPLRRSVVLALVAVIVIAAAVTAAIGYGLPGIRILFGPPPSLPASPSAPASAAPGAGLGLGLPMSLEEADDAVDFEIGLPELEAIGPPDAVYLAGGRLALAWGPDPGLPGTASPDLGLLIIELRATVDEGMIEKLLLSGTHVEWITFDGARGYWIDGERHVLAYTAPDGSRIEDTLRQVGNSLLWTRDGVTYRLEAELSRDAAIELAESFR
ncbi:MAG: hypothetical protein AB1736_04345 [Chloroflexota bacterium]